MSSHNVGCQLFRPYCNIWSHSKSRTASNSKHHFGLNRNSLANFHSSTYVGLLKVMSYWNVTSCSQMWSNVSEEPFYLSSGYKFINKITRCHVTEVRNLCVYRCENRRILLNGCYLCSIQIMNFVYVVVIIIRPTSQEGRGIVLFLGRGGCRRIESQQQILLRDFGMAFSEHVRPLYSSNTADFEFLSRCCWSLISFGISLTFRKIVMSSYSRSGSQKT